MAQTDLSRSPHTGAVRASMSELLEHGVQFRVGHLPPIEVEYADYRTHLFFSKGGSALYREISARSPITILP
jgi:hypothetical protein